MKSAATKQPLAAEAANRVNTVSNILGVLLWVAEKCEDAHDFEQFHSLALELAPRMGVTLELAVRDLGEITTGLFERDGERCHG